MHDDRPATCARRCAAAISSWCSCRSVTHDLDDLHYYTVGEDRLFAILPEAHRAGRAGPVPLRWSSLADHPLVCGDGCPFWEAADRAFREQGLSVTPKAIATRAEWLFELVSAGVGIGLCRPS